ncbi:MAG: ABC transporter substrate-binding protein [Paracoccaceae bacterium]
MRNRLKSFLAAAAFIAASSPAQTMAETLHYATIGEPPSLDIQMGTATLSTTIGQHVFELPFAFDSKMDPQPMLAESGTVSEDGMTIVMQFRQGVKFHNGAEMKAVDVAASLNRWGEFGARGKALGVASAEATGDYEVTLKLSAPNGAWKSFLAYPNGGPAIYPADIVGAAGGEPLKPENYIGTGPYKFGEWRPNRYVELTKFDDYSPRSEPMDGEAGAREAMFDTLQFIPVPDVGTRVSGVQAGDYDYAEYVSGDLFGMLKDDAGVTPYVSSAPIFGLMFVNSQEGYLAGKYPLRRAILTALNMTEALQVSVGDEELWDAQGSFFPKGSIWYTEAGTENYSQGDAAKAAEMAKAAGYDGTPISFLVSTNYQQHFDQANVFKRQLADAGINVELDVADWATLMKQRAEPKQWDFFMTHHGPSPDPTLLTFMNDNYPGWWTSPEKQELAAILKSSTDAAVRQETWVKLQELVYEQVPAVKVGDVFSFDIGSPKLQASWDRAPAFPYFWGASK